MKLKKIICLLLLISTLQVSDVLATGEPVPLQRDDFGEAFFDDKQKPAGCKFTDMMETGLGTIVYSPLNAGFNYRHLINILKKPYYAFHIRATEPGNNPEPSVSDIS